MKYAFKQFELDAVRQELKSGDAVQRLPQRVFDTIYVLISNRERAVSKDELAEKVWNGRAVSDDSIAAAIKTVRSVLGDDGKSQVIIRTQHGFGFRWMIDVRVTDDGSQAVLNRDLQDHDSADPLIRPAQGGRPSIAILPFAMVAVDDRGDFLGDALAAELIVHMAKLRWLKVTARGSSFRFRERNPDPQSIARLLGVRYALSGAVEDRGRQVGISLELARTSDGTVLWSERLSGLYDLLHELRSRIVSAVISALELHIPAEEANAALTMAPENLDAWGEYHVGLRHLYRYNRRDMALAKARFEAAITREPDFARAHAGLSFIAFQQAFMHFSDERERSISLATEYAERSLSCDPLDPFGNYCMGRACWVAGDLDSAKLWSRRSYEIAPSYAHGHYLYAMMDLYSGGTETALTESTASLSLSPLDPLSYGMLATHASALIGQDNPEAAALWAERAATRPEAHYLIDMIAAAANHMNGMPERADHWVRKAKARRPDASGADFFESFQYRDCRTRANLSQAFESLGF